MPDKTKGQQTIDHFFNHEQRPSSAPSKKLLAIRGLSLISNLVTRDEEEQLLKFLASQHWRTDLARRVIHYGGTYCLMPPHDASPEERRKIESTIITADPIPANFQFLISLMIEHRVYTDISRPEFCIVNEYTGNQGISAHVENFRFDEPVCGLTLGDGDWMRFHELVVPDDGSVRSGKAAQAQRTGNQQDIWLPPRSLLVMQGDSRFKWQHEILRSRKDRNRWNWKRTSLTFRTLHRDGNEGERSDPSIATTS